MCFGGRFWSGCNGAKLGRARACCVNTRLNSGFNFITRDAKRWTHGPNGFAPPRQVLYFSQGFCVWRIWNKKKNKRKEKKRKTTDFAFRGGKFPLSLCLLFRVRKTLFQTTCALPQQLKWCTSFILRKTKKKFSNSRESVPNMLIQPLMLEFPRF